MLIDFLKTKRTKTELQTALDVIRDFKANESPDEWGMVPFACWVKLEQLQEYLAHLAESKLLKPDTIAFMKEHEAWIKSGGEKT